MHSPDQRAAIDAYKTSSIEHAPGIKIVRMLYEGALRFLDRAIAAGGDDPEFGVWVSRADAIVLELRLSIDESHAPELSSNLHDLYLFCEQSLTRAVQERVTAPVQEARDVLDTLLQAWKSLELDGKGAGA